MSEGYRGMVTFIILDVVVIGRRWRHDGEKDDHFLYRSRAIQIECPTNPLYTSDGMGSNISKLQRSDNIGDAGGYFNRKKGILVAIKGA